MLVRCDFMEPPEKGGGPTDRLLCWDPGGGWPLVGSWTGWRNPASHRSRKQPELVPPVAGRRTRVLFSTSSTESGGATCAPRLAFLGASFGCGRRNAGGDVHWLA